MVAAVLSELAVRDLGVIDELSLVLSEGMTALTGETGAGKTLVVGAIDLLTGGRADASLVRPGANAAEIEGRFVVGDEEIVVRRVIPADGRSRAYIDGHLATVAALGELGADLIDLHGQHAHQSLLKSAVQRSALDRFGAICTARLQELIDEQRHLQGALADLGGDVRARLREIDLLRHQVTEIEAAAIADADEDERLDRDESLLADAAAHLDAAAAAVELLDADGAVSDGVAQARAALDGRAPFADLGDRLAAVSAEVADIAGETRARCEGIDDDPAALAAVQERRALLAGLRRKYGSTLGEVLQFQAAVAARLDELEGYEATAASLEQRLGELTRRLATERDRVRGERLTAAPRLAAAVESHLGELALRGARMEVGVDGEAGEQVSLRIAANRGHEPRPLVRVASGGELARVMLALRLVLTAGPPTLVFDEVDAGIGGAAAQAVGHSLARLSAAHQVLVVTHLAQVAAHADHHIVVEKSQADDAAAVRLRMVSGDDRVIELSRMLSGSPDSAAAHRHAIELLAESRARAGPQAAAATAVR